MDAQELRNLQEAYLEVVMNEETDKTGNHLDTYASKKYFGDKEKQEKLMRRMNRLRGKTEQQKEQVDIYDIILSHLLDEGYAETPEAAEAIMVNMSEEWREEIVAEMSYQPVSKEKESRIKKQMTAAKKSSKEASKTGDFEAAARHDERSRAMKAKVKRSDLPY
jgi:hypothetical protein